MKSRGMSQIITTVIMIGIVLVAIGAVWVVAQNILSEGLEDVSLGSLKVNLDIENVKVTDTGLDVKVKRNSGEANLVGINFIVSDGENTEVFEEETDMKELATQTFSLDYDGVVESVEIAPVLANDEGKEKVYDSVEKKEVTVVGKSCKDILDKGDSVGNGIYGINLNDGSTPFKVYCEMDTKEGGWTLLMKANGSSDVFKYSADYWTTNNVLNYNDLELGNANAKYESFNSLEITEVMAIWPEIDHIMHEDIEEQTALILFSTPKSIYNETVLDSCSSNYQYGDFDKDNFLSQPGYQRYGFNLDSSFGCSSSTYVRWGWVWNNEVVDCGSSDVVTGIGLSYATGLRASSMGSWSTCCPCSGDVGAHPYQVLIFGR